MGLKLMRLASALSLVALMLVASPAPHASALSGYTTPVWSKRFPAGDSESSPSVGNLNGQNDVLFGSLDGKVYALNGSNGNTVNGWPQQTVGQGVLSSPSIADTNGDGNNEVFVGAGDSRVNPNNHQNTGPGGYYSFRNDGAPRWRVSADDPDYADHGVTTSLAIGDVNHDNAADVTGGAIALTAYSINENGNVNAGWPIPTDDSQWSSAALQDVNGDGTTDIVEGGDSAAGSFIDWDGGILRAIDGSGHILWYHQFDEIIRSSPSIGDVDGDGVPDIVVGSGNFYYQKTGGKTHDSNRIFVFDLHGNLKWQRNLAGTTLASPTLVDLRGDGVYEIAIGTWDPTGRIYLYDGFGNAFSQFGGTNGIASTGGVILGQIITADLNSDGTQDLIVPTGGGVFAYSGATGAQLFSIRQGAAWYQNSAWIGDIDGNGKLDLITVGNDPHTGEGIADRYELTGATLGPGAWTQFHANARHTGNVNNIALQQNYCGNGPGGYRMVASDGGIFSFCASHFYGSIGGHRLNQPIVGMVSTPSGNGYWEVASDGGIFSFGDANFYGSTGGIHLNQPIVGMASTPSGHGYWLVASDGGIFAFGDANFYGSTGALHLNQPIVGMASSSSGHGYWLVASDGGIFAFGDANFYGSTGALHLNSPIVGMTAGASGHGYWLVAADGGIFSFGNANFYGSTGGSHLNRPIVGITATPSHGGYWLVASDGGIFGFGDAPFYGSMGGTRLVQPVVGMGS